MLQCTFAAQTSARIRKKLIIHKGCFGILKSENKVWKPPRLITGGPQSPPGIPTVTHSAMIYVSYNTYIKKRTVYCVKRNITPNI